MNLKEVRNFFEKDYFAAECGIQINELTEDGAICELEIKEKHLNAGGVVQGGALFTLGDFTFAVAANSKDRLTVSLENHITYMHPAKGEKIIATAKEISSTKTLCFYEVTMTNESGNIIAKMSITGFMK